MIKTGRVSIERLAILCLFVFYSSTNAFWGYRLFHETDIVPVLACVIPGFLVFTCLLRQDRITIRSDVILPLLAVYTVIIISGGLNPKYILFYGMCFIFFFLDDMAESRDILKLFYYLAILFSFGSLINLLLPDVYMRVILPEFIGSSQYKGLLSWVPKRIIPGFTNQTSFNACHFVYGIGFLMTKYSIDKKLTAPEYLSLALFLSCLVLTSKRAHFLFVIAALLLCYFFSAKHGETGKRLIILVIASAAALAVIYCVAQYVNFGLFRKFNTMITDMANEEDVTSGRLALYALAIRYFIKNPLLGIGWEQYRTISELTSPISTHNIYLELLCETGVIGFTIFMSFFMKMFVISVSNCKRWNGDLTPRFCLFMQLFFLIYGITGNPLYDPPYYIPYFMICAFTCSLDQYISNSELTPVLNGGFYG